MTTSCLTFLLAFSAGVANGDSSLKQQLTPFLKQHCLDCHSGQKPEAGLDLEAFSFEMADAEVRRRWVHLHDRVASDEMPPASEARPKPNAKSVFLTAIGESLTRAELANRKHVLRRMNRREYEHTVRDMFGIHVDVKRLLPDDATEQGFDTTASALSLSAEQMVLYLEAADLVLDQVFGPPNQPQTIRKTVNFATTRRGISDSERKLDDGVVLFSSAKFLPLYDASLPGPGLYRVRVKVRAEQSKQPVVMHVQGGVTGAIAPHTAGFFEAPPGKAITIEFTDRAIENSDSLGFGLVGGFPWWRVEADNYQGAGLFLGDIEVEGPIESWPPVSREKLLGEVDAQPPHDIRDHTRIIERARQLYDIMYLAIQTDSTRLITYTVGDSSYVPQLPGVSMNYHDLSHHGQDPEKLQQLGIVESEHVKTFGAFLRRLKETREADSNLLERTMVLMGSHMHSGGHNNRNLPIILAGGGFRHGRHLAFDRDNNCPLANLYVTMLQRLGLETDRFASSTGTMTGLEINGS